jgi:Ca2+/H+ antiporter
MIWSAIVLVVAVVLMALFVLGLVRTTRQREDAFQQSLEEFDVKERA